MPERLRLARIDLRRASEADLPGYCRRIYCDAQVMRHLPGGAAVPLEAALPRARRHLLTHWDEHGFGTWLVERHGDGRVLGHCGLAVWPDSDDVEVLYALERPAWGQGLATEAARAAVRAGFEHLGLARIIAAVVPENVASRTVLERIGLRGTGTLDWNGLHVQMLALDRVDWQVHAQ